MGVFARSFISVIGGFCSILWMVAIAHAADLPAELANSVPDGTRIRKIYNEYRDHLLHHGQEDEGTVEQLQKYLKSRDAYLAAQPTPTEAAPAWAHETLVDEVAGPLELTDVLSRFTGYLTGTMAMKSSEDMALNFSETSDNNLTALGGRNEFWPALMKDITEARDSINVHVFGMQDDPWGREFAQALKAKVDQGVKVRLIADQIGARMTSFTRHKSRKLMDFYRASGIEVKYYADKGTRGLYHYDHRKYFVIDGKIAYNTGYTIENHMREKEYDVAFRAEGTIVRQLQASFFMSWRYIDGTVDLSEGIDKFLSRYFPALESAPGAMKARLTINVPDQQNRITEGYYSHIASAHKFAYVMNPYFTDEGIVKALIQAAKNGADVRVITPALFENEPYYRETLYWYERLNQAGVKTYLFKGKEGFGMLHAKGVVTEDFTSFGSANMCSLGLYHNFEQNIESTDPAFVEQVKTHLLDEQLKYSELWTIPSDPKAREQIGSKWRWLLKHFYY